MRIWVDLGIVVVMFMGVGLVFPAIGDTVWSDLLKNLCSLTVAVLLTLLSVLISKDSIIGTYREVILLVFWFYTMFSNVIFVHRGTVS